MPVVPLFPSARKLPAATQEPRQSMAGVMDYKDIDFSHSPFRAVTTISKGHAEAWAATFNAITKVLCNACEGTDQSE